MSTGRSLGLTWHSPVFFTHPWATIVRLLTGEAEEGLRAADVKAYYRTTDG